MTRPLRTKPSIAEIYFCRTSSEKPLVNNSSTVHISAAKNIGLDDLLAAIDARLEIDALQRLRLRVPQSEGKVLAQIEARAHILKRSYRDSAVHMEVDAPESLVRVLQPYVVVPRKTNPPRRH